MPQTGNVTVIQARANTSDGSRPVSLKFRNINGLIEKHLRSKLFHRPSKVFGSLIRLKRVCKVGGNQILTMDLSYRVRDLVGCFEHLGTTAESQVL
jgi:hypothetical protein